MVCEDRGKHLMGTEKKALKVYAFGQGFLRPCYSHLSFFLTGVSGEGVFDFRRFG